MIHSFSKTRILLHLVAWLTFFLLPFLFLRYGTPRPDISAEEIETLVLPSLFVSNFFLVGFFYLNYIVLFYRFYVTKKYLLYILIIMASLLGVTILSLLGMYFLLGINVWLLPVPFFGNVVFRFFILLIFSSGLAMYDTWRLVESEKLKAEVAYLKAQINPHFLFNTLNSIYFLAIKKADNTADSIVKLSNIMRYVTHQSKQDIVPLDQEINYIDSYIELQKLRLTNQTILDYTITNTSTNKKIAPLLLISFIENAFKYGVSTEHESTITIKIKADDYQLNLLVQNEIIKKETNTITETPTGLGIQNTTQRLQLLYPKQHKLTISNHNHIYTVELMVLLI